VTTDDRTLGDVANDDTPGLNNRTLPNRDVGENDDPVTEPDVVLYGHGFVNQFVVVREFVTVVVVSLSVNDAVPSGVKVVTDLDFTDAVHFESVEMNVVAEPSRLIEVRRTVHAESRSIGFDLCLHERGVEPAFEGRS
jgi:hypothetical protein